MNTSFFKKTICTLLISSTFLNPSVALGNEMVKDAFVIARMEGGCSVIMEISNNIMKNDGSKKLLTTFLGALFQNIRQLENSNRNTSDILDMCTITKNTYPIFEDYFKKSDPEKSLTYLRATRMGGECQVADLLPKTLNSLPRNAILTMSINQYQAGLKRIFGNDVSRMCNDSKTIAQRFEFPEHVQNVFKKYKKKN